MQSGMVGYLDLLRRNTQFRRLWLGQVTSLLGDWLDFVALNTLLWHLTGRAESIGWLFVCQHLPAALFGTWSGVIVDRLPRRLVMIGADLGCALVVLSFLFVHDVDQIWIIYAATAIKHSLCAFFEPAREALIPCLTARDDLVSATAISGITWSTMLAGGAAAGGLVAGKLGITAAFLLDSLSFLASAWFTWKIVVDESAIRQRPRTHPFQDMTEVFGFLHSHREVLLYTLSKALWCLGGGVLVLLTLFGTTVFTLAGDDGSLTMGLLYSARGIGAGLGPFLAQRLGGSSIPFMRRALGPGFVLMSIGYAALSFAPSLAWACAALVLAHVGGSVQWVFSTALIQLSTPNRIQGRLFALEIAMYALTLCASCLLTSWAIDQGWDMRHLALGTSSVFLAPAALMAYFLWRRPSAESSTGPDH